ncbi:OLC1v1021941C2 [Oldenlandia corymbosa var. corymbosa]|nr:OLC1v1021941C2 [Oldenlandia corymbosa var. corymbosa]
MHGREIEMLKDEVRVKLLATPSSVDEKMKLIDSLEQLGISYHFEADIQTQLQKIFNWQMLEVNNEESTTNYFNGGDHDLFTVALHFRLFRQHGFNISCDHVFHKLMDAEGTRFKESLCSDIRGLLSLYEASQLRSHDDVILEEAFRFSTTHLNRWLRELQQQNVEQVGGSADVNFVPRVQVENAIRQPIHKCMTRLAARRYISIYEQTESCDRLLLRLAKLDFNFLQLLYKEELLEVVRWADETEIISKNPYSRSRLAESYFYGVGMFYEPQHSFGRIITAKTSLLLTAIDDTYDSFGTLDELKTFTDAIEKWNPEESQRLPNFMRTSYMALLRAGEEVDKELTRQGRTYASDYYKYQWKEYARTSYIQAPWFINRELPTFQDYFENGLTTGLGYVSMAMALLGLENATKDVYDWLATYPEILVGVAKICRMNNDISSHKREKEISGTGIQCYMNQYNVSEEEAMAKFEEMVEDGWKDMNEECLKSNPMSRETLMSFFNLARMVHVFYGDGVDGFTNPHQVTEPYIRAVLVDPIPA